MKTWVFNCSVILVLLLLLSFPNATIVHAGPVMPTFVVDSFLDGADTTIDGICQARVGLAFACNLRAALQEAAVLVKTQNVVIHVPLGTYALTLAPDSCKEEENCGDLDLASLNTTYANMITIIGTGQQPLVIDANHLDRVLHIGAFHKVRLENLVVQGGRLSSDTRGAGIFIQDRGDVELNGVMVKDNEIICPVDQPTCAEGGGIAANESNLSISHSQFLENKAIIGSAMYLRDAADPVSNTTIMSSTISGQQGSFDSVIFSQTNLRLINTTMTDNTAIPVEVYGYPCNLHTSGRLWVQNSTLVFPDNGVNIDNYSTISESIRIHDSILLNLTDAAGGSEGNCKVGTEVTAIKSTGANVFSDGTCNPGFGDLRDVVLPPGVLTDPSQVLLGPLRYNGGKVKTMAPMPGFVGVDRRLTTCFYTIAGTNEPQVLWDDARDFPRNDWLCDSAAVEGVMLSVYLPVISR